MVVRGPYTAIPAPARSRPLTPTSRLPGHTPKMVPTAKLVSMIDDPSRGSNATEYPCDRIHPTTTNGNIITPIAKMFKTRRRCWEVHAWTPSHDRAMETKNNQTK